MDYPPPQMLVDDSISVFAARIADMTAANSWTFPADDYSGTDSQNLPQSVSAGMSSLSINEADESQSILAQTVTVPQTQSQPLPDSALVSEPGPGSAESDVLLKLTNPTTSDSLSGIIANEQAKPTGGPINGNTITLLSNSKDIPGSDFPPILDPNSSNLDSKSSAPGGEPSVLLTDSK